MDALIFTIISVVFMGVFKPDILTILFLCFMMLIMILCTLGPRNKISRLKLSLEMLLNELKQVNTKQQIIVVFNKENFTYNNFLNNQIKAYLMSNNRSKDIEDYINDEVIDRHINRRLLNWVPSLFTALGILGTFMGLIIGLHKFDPSTADGIVSSITALLNGIKVAFYTSIFGIGASILFNFFYKQQCEALDKTLDAFFDYLSKYINPNEEHLKTVEGLERRKTQALEKLSGDIANELATAMNNSVVPTMQELKNATFGYIEKAVEAQSGTLQYLVNGFMEQLHKAMKNQFNDMAGSIKELCTWQNNTSDKLSDIFKQLEVTIEKFDGVSLHMKTISDNHKNIESSLNLSIEKIIKYVQTLEDYQSMTHRWVEEMKAFTANNLEISKTFVAVPEKVDELIFSIEKFKNNTNEFNVKIADSATAYEEQINRIIEKFVSNSTKIIEEINNASLANTESQKEMSVKLVEEFKKYESSVQSAVDRINNSVKAFNKSVDNTIEAFSIKGDKMIEEAKEFDRIEHKLKQDVEKNTEKVLSEISKTSENVEKQLNTISENVAVIDDIKNTVIAENEKIDSVNENVQKVVENTAQRRSLFRWEGRKTEE